MASVGFGTSMAVAPAAAAGMGSGRRLRRTQVVAATRGQAAPKKQEKGILDFIVGAIVKDEQLLIETDPLLNKVDTPAPSPASGTVSKKKPAADDGGGGFSLGGLFAKKG